MFGESCFRALLEMAHQQAAAPAGARPSRFYFAYGSNLHLAQMRRRCPASKLIGCARLAHYRWQINERGYANIVAAQGCWVDGLVYEISEKDEARLDINEGVSKNAYTKFYLPVLLRPAAAPLYRRPTSWIVDKGGPAKVCLQARQAGLVAAEHSPRWEQHVLVYVSVNYVVDSKPKDEYVNRINKGLVDARALGVGDDYIDNCIRPYVPSQKKHNNTNNNNSNNNKNTAARKNASPPGNPEPSNVSPARGKARQGVKRNAPHPSPDPSPARKPSQKNSHAGPKTQDHLAPIVVHTRARASSDVGTSTPPPLPPRPPPRRFRSIPVIVVEDARQFRDLRDRLG